MHIARYNNGRTAKWRKQSTITGENTRISLINALICDFRVYKRKNHNRIEKTTQLQGTWRQRRRLMLMVRKWLALAHQLLI